MTEAAAAFVAVRPRSVAETRQRLERLGYRADLVSGVLDRFIELGYLDDAQFTRWLVQSRDRGRPRGANALHRELALKGVERELIDAVLAERASAGVDTPSGTGDSVERQAALKLLERRRRALEREPDGRRRRARAYALLARNGFAPEVCHEMAAALSAEDAAVDEGAAVDTLQDS